MSFLLRGKLRSVRQGDENYVSVSDFAMMLTLAAEDAMATSQEAAALRLIRDGLLNGIVVPV